MPITYDGEKVFKTNDTDLESYENWRKKDLEEVNKILKEKQSKNRQQALQSWREWCPEQYAHATIKSISEFDTNSASLLLRSVKQSQVQHHPLNLVINSDRSSGGKTWAMYAYISALIKADVINDPESEVRIVSESNLFDELRDFNTRTDAMRRLFSSDVKLIAIDNIRGIEDKSGLVWPRVLDNAISRQIALVFCMNLDIDTMRGEQLHKSIGKITDAAVKIRLEGWSK